MTVTVTGSVGANFNVSTSNTSTATGSVTVVASLPAALSLTLTNSNKAVSYSGYVGTNSVDLNLLSLSDISGTGALITATNNTAPVVLSSVSSIVFYNTHATNTLQVKPGSATSYLPASEQITIQPGEAKQFVYPTPASIGSNGKIGLVGSGASTTLQIYILGS